MSLREHGDAVVQALRDAGLNTGDGIRPPDVGWTGIEGKSDFIPYVVVYQTGGGNVDGSIGEPREDITVVYQVTCVGATRSQADWVRDAVREVLFDRAATVIAGRRIVGVNLDVPLATIRDDDVKPHVFYSADRYRIQTTPAKETI